MYYYCSPTKKKQTGNVHNMDETQTHYTEQKKLETKECIQYDVMYMPFKKAQIQSVM